jgi:hypothetical protein
MADYTEQERADVQRQLMEEMRQYGQITSGTADSLRDAQVGVKGFSKQVRTSATDVTKAYADLTKQLYSGAQGMSAFNNAVESTATQVASFGMLMGGPIIKAVSVALLGLVKVLGAAAASSDAAFSAYQKLAEIGGTAGDQLSGLRDESARLGYVIADSNEGLNSFVNLISDNADALALFKGNVFEGRHALANVSTAFDEYRTGLRRMGFTQDQQNKGMASYIRLQTTLGQAQTKTNYELAAGANKYLQETTALAAVTGQKRTEVEAEMQRALSEQKFRATIDELYATGQEGLAEQYMALNIMLAKQSPEAAAGFRAMAGGSLEAVESQKLLRTTTGEIIPVLEAMRQGQLNAAGGFNKIAGAAGKTAENFRPLAKLANIGDTFIDYAQSSNLAMMANQDMTKQYEAAIKQGKIQRNNTEKELKDQVETRENQLEASLTMQEFVRKFVSLAGTISRTMSDVFKTLAKYVNSFADTVINVIDYIKYDLLKLERPDYSAKLAEELKAKQQKVTNDLETFKKTGQMNIQSDDDDALNRYGGKDGKKLYEQDKLEELKKLKEQELANEKKKEQSKVFSPLAGDAAGELDSQRMAQYLQKIALVESGGSTAAGANTKNAKGMFQFLDNTFKGTAAQMGRKDIQAADVHDAKKSNEVASFFTKENAKIFRKRFGREPTDTELYMMHFLGPEGGPRFLDNLASNPYAQITEETFGTAAFNNNKNIFVDKQTKRNRTFDEVFNLMGNKIAGAASGLSSGRYGGAAISEDVKNIQGYSSGGVSAGPDSGYLAVLHGREAVVPLPNGDSIPVSFNAQELARNLNEAMRSSGDTNSSGIATLLAGIQDMVRLQRDQNDLLGRMLQHQRA